MWLGGALEPQRAAAGQLEHEARDAGIPLHVGQQAVVVVR